MGALFDLADRADAQLFQGLVVQRDCPGRRGTSVAASSLVGVISAAIV
jgi:hypothetical protein